MSCVIDIENYPLQKRKQILNDLTLYSNESKYADSKKVSCFANDPFSENGVIVPFAYANTSSLVNTHSSYPSTSTTFIGKLNQVQTEIKDEAINILETNKSILISLYTGAGKTAFAIYLACHFKLKTLIFVHRVNIIDQWEQSIHKFCKNATIQKITEKKQDLIDADFYLINVDIISSRTRKEFKNIGLLISDESHCICTENRSNALMMFQPKYLIGLTATPERTDGMDKILLLYFGEYWIIREMNRMFNVYIVNTNYKPVSKTQKNGNMDWNSVISSQCENEDRNKLIVKLSRYFLTRNILILCKRKTQVEMVYDMLNTFENVEKYTGTQKNFNVKCRILVSTFSKSGIGFDFEKLDMLIIASDVNEGIQQYLGRVFRKRNTYPIIIDLRDNVYKNHPLSKHLQERINMYEQSGGIIKNFNLNFYDFL